MSAPQAEAAMRGMKAVAPPRWQDDPQWRIAVALETLAGCTGWLDPTTGQRQHDGDTCPVHEGQDDVEFVQEQGILHEWRNWFYRNVGV